MNDVIAFFQEMRDSNGFEVLVSREFDDNEGTPIHCLIGHLMSEHGPSVDYMILGSCVLIRDLWVELCTNSLYRGFANNSLRTDGLEKIQSTERAIRRKISKGQNQPNELECFELKVTNEEFSFIGALNQYFREVYNYLSEVDSRLSASIALSMLVEYFSNRGIQEFDGAELNWLYSEKLSQDVAFICEKRLEKNDLLDYADQNLPHLKNEE